MKKYVVLGALFSFTLLHILLSGCTTGLVSTQKETRSTQNISTLQGTDKNGVRFCSKDGITTYIIRDRNGKMVGMRMVKAPWAKIPVPRCYPDKKTIPVNKDRQEAVEKTKTARTQRLQSPSPISETPVFPEIKKESYSKTSFRPLPGDEEMYCYAVPNSNKSQIDGNQDTEIRERMLREEDNFKKEKKKLALIRYRHGKSMAGRSPHELGDNSDNGVKAGKKTYSFGMAFPAKWLPGFVLRAVELKKGGDFNFKIPIPSLDRDVKFGLKFKSNRLELSNDLERTVIGLFTIDFGGKEVKKAANFSAADGSYF